MRLKLLQRRKQLNYALCLPSSDTDNLFLPLALLAAKILLPLAVDMRSRKPCLFLLFLCEGWNVLFMTFYSIVVFKNKSANVVICFRS